MSSGNSIMYYTFGLSTNSGIMLIIFFRILLAILLADFMTGIVHWWEDAYGNPNWSILGKSLIEPNLRHHKYPREFIKGSYWSRINTSMYLGLLLLGLCCLFSIFNIYSFICIAIAAHGNEIHRLSHQTDKENGRLIVLLQKTGIMQSRRHHGLHHNSPFECNYCVMTNFVNPVLQSINFWHYTEQFLAVFFGIKVLRGSVLRSNL
jgi:ubiquitin-conjugating enzyme E2 variant